MHRSEESRDVEILNGGREQSRSVEVAFFDVGTKTAEELQRIHSERPAKVHLGYWQCFYTGASKSQRVGLPCGGRSVEFRLYPVVLAALDAVRDEWEQRHSVEWRPAEEDDAGWTHERFRFFSLST